MFPDLSCQEEQMERPVSATRPEEARVNKPVRDQVEIVLRNLDSTLAEDHPARAIWAFLERLDLTAFYAVIQAIDGVAGRPATDPKALLALWLYATAEGIGSAHQLARLCEEHDAFRWLRGGVPINYHMLSDFRTAQGPALDEVLSQILAAMMKADLVSLKRVSQDGVRVRSDAGAASFRRQKTLVALLGEAKEQVERLAKEREHPDGQVSKRQRAARERAARERVQRIEEALAQMPLVQAVKKTEEQKAEARVSTTDPESRVMKMPDGGFRPASNIEIATDTGSQVIVGVGVINRGNDFGEASLMLKKVEERCGKAPEDYLADGGFATLEEVKKITAAGVTLYAPTRVCRGMDGDQCRPHPGDSPEVADWRARMGTEEAKEIYKERAATSECVNAQIRERYGIRQFALRGLAKQLMVVLMVAITHNLLRWMALAS
jgi:transposase